MQDALVVVVQSFERSNAKFSASCHGSLSQPGVKNVPINHTDKRFAHGHVYLLFSRRDHAS